MEMQFRYKFYRDPKFPFLKSLGIKHIFQSFDAGDDIGFIGILHLWWVRDSTGTVTDIWESEWIDSPHEGIALAKAVSQNKLYDEEKVVLAHKREIQKMAEKEGLRQLREKSRKDAEEESKNFLWN
ncbi:uncharacterized protein METZ01_LOCUS224677 [marine metagenome]|uniref:Uncharacterized protein n=1 Tax=marine metagenome TaxID=408172 RepID=A0A382GB46_9ZZZZ